MKIEINKTEQDILHHALLKCIKDAVEARVINDITGVTMSDDPVRIINDLHKKVISATETEPCNHQWIEDADCYEYCSKCGIRKEEVVATWPETNP